MSLRLQKVMWVFLALFIAAAAAWRGFYPVELEDIWWHLATGRWIAQHHAVPAFDVFAINSQHAIQGISPQWLGSLTLFTVQSLTGFTGLKILRIFLILLPVILWILWARRYKISPFIIAIIAICLCETFLLRSNLRPFLFNPTFLMIWIFWLNSLLSSQRIKYWPAVAILLIIWRNIHMGFFTYGGLALAIFILWSILKVFQDSSIEKKEYSKQIWNNFQPFLWASAAFVLAWIINPYGWEGIVYPFRTFTDPQFIQFYKLKSVIAELQSPLTTVFRIKYWWLWTLMASTSWIVMSARQQRLLLLILWGAALTLFFYAFRAIDFCVIMAAFCIIIAWKDRQTSLWDHRLGAIILILLLVGNAMALQPNHLATADRLELQQSLKIDPSCPQKSIEFIQNNWPNQIIFNSSLDGGYIDWAGYPKVRAFVDNRQYNLDLWGNYYLGINHPEQYWPQLQSDYGFRTVLINVEHAPSLKLLRYLKNQTDWHVVLIDGPHVIFRQAECQNEPDVCAFEQNLQEQKISQENIKDFERFTKQPDHLINISYHHLYWQGYALMELGYSGASLQTFIKTFEIGISTQHQDLIPVFSEYFRKQLPR